ncbi:MULTISPECIES: hypothetical protein [Romboutsia]|uniref:Uncharacterized protein n=1 Tax=Romboutsia hominis TaxID=1507512 RepID=A0A2P2BS80_9FIRM|nr:MULTISPECIES: hypothetical protein [Romboutsia]MCH1960459.1 hypothetical protein [Romboutsia hominis]MCH1969108.1 hypothetical protein [Romboutsia hominis]MDB8791842.1 hypothetical protein [Romboutsia sp. 1001216sp1]MDB8793398.1 hypothetical protein [Romboutsia sp. 1001216sp1]MDB8796825.1 hypothetical protein [Romboutsia sp. 1001216sp1]
MSCPNCKCNKSKISNDEYEELKEYFKDEIQDYKIVDYIKDNGNHSSYVEVELEDYIVEIEDIDTDNLNLDKVIDALIRNSVK